MTAFCKARRAAALDLALELLELWPADPSSYPVSAPSRMPSSVLGSASVVGVSSLGPLPSPSSSASTLAVFALQRLGSRAPNTSTIRVMPEAELTSACTRANCPSLTPAVRAAVTV